MGMWDRLLAVLGGGRTVASSDASPRRLPEVGLRPTEGPRVDPATVRVANSREGYEAFIGSGAGPLHDRQRTYPGDELDPATVQAIFREADKGYWLVRYADLWDDVRQRDYQIANLDRGRRVAITTKKFLVHPFDARDPVAVGLADAVRTMIDGIDGFDSSVYSMLSANGPGYALMEPVYRYGGLRFSWDGSSQVVEGLHPRDLRWIHQRHLWFAWDTDEPHLDLGAKSGKLPLSKAPNKLFLFQAPGDGLASARGFFRVAAWLHLLGQTSMVSGGIFLKRYGVPPLAAFMPQAQWKDEVMKAAVIKHLQDFGDGLPSVFPDFLRDMVKIDTQAIGSGAVNLHMQWRGFIDACLAKAIQGAVLQAEASGGGPGSYALGAVHEARSYDVSVVDSIGSCEKLRSGLVAAWVRLNGAAIGRVFGVPPEELLARLPMLSRRIDRETTPKERAEILCMFADRGMSGSQGQIRNEYAIDAPTDDSDRFDGKPIPLSQAGATVSPATANAGYEKPAPAPARPAQETP